METTEEMGFMCAKCKLINVLPQEIVSVEKEENKCRCGGVLIPLGYARVVTREKKKNEVVVILKADTTMALGGQQEKVIARMIRDRM